MKRHKKTGRRFVQHVKGKTVPGLQIEIPDALKGTPRRPNAPRPHGRGTADGCYSPCGDRVRRCSR